MQLTTSVYESCSTTAIALPASLIGKSKWGLSGIVRPPCDDPRLAVVVEDHEAVVSSRGKVSVVTCLPAARANTDVGIEVRQDDPDSTRRRCGRDSDLSCPCPGHWLAAG